jgi:signal transduction histidine kinase
MAPDEETMDTTDLATFIRENTDPILAEWEAFARTLARDSPVDVAALREHAGVMLEEIASDIETPQSKREQSAKSRGLRQDTQRDSSAALAAAELGRDRAGSGFTVVEMMAEFRALRASVTRLWIEQSSEFGRAELQALVRFNEAIDQAVAYSLERYVGDIEQTRQRFLAILSHDLRNPLSAIGAASSFLEELGELDEEKTKLVTMIHSATTRMTHLVDDMLELARTRLGEAIPIQRAEVEIGKLVDTVVAEIRASYGDATIEVESRGNLVGRWDAARLAQALANLITNAVQHGDSAEPVHVAARGDDKEVAIEVRNSGPPIPNERLARIFDAPKPGRRASGDRRHLGLGLFIVNKIVEGHGGTIDVSSADAATTFTIHLPRARP